MLPRLKALLPASVKTKLREAVYAGLVGDLDSYRTYLTMTREPRGISPLREQRSVRLRGLGGRYVQLRRGTTDPTTVFTTFFHRFHRPPKGAALRAKPLILDLGANIGLTMADFATTYPLATVVGVELDRENAAICRQNVSPWAERCRVIEGAIWFEDGELTYESSVGSEDAFSVSATESVARGKTVSTPAFNIGSILRELGEPEVVDFVKMDIEGAESEVLEKNTDWAMRVQAIKVELHHGYTHEMAIAALRRMGFRATRATDHADAVVGVRGPAS